MAGAGFKSFTAGEVLEATEVNTYLMQQTIMVFAGTAERDAALGTAVSEGMFTYRTDDNALEYYTGTSWEAFSAGGSGGAYQKHFLLMGA